MCELNAEGRPFGVACARGWLDTDAYTVGCFPQSSGGYAVSRLDTGELDAAFLGSTPIAISNARGVLASTFQMGRGHGSSQGLGIRRWDAVTGAATGSGLLGLQGLCLASPFSSTAHYHLLYLLDMLELPVCAGSTSCPDSRDFTCVSVRNMSPPALMAAWDAGEIDGAYVWGAGLIHLRATGASVIIDSSVLKAWGDETYDIVAARDQFEDDFPGLLAHIARVKVLLDDSYVAADATWDASTEGDSTHLACLQHPLLLRQLLDHHSLCLLTPIFFGAGLERVLLRLFQHAIHVHHDSFLFLLIHLNFQAATP